MQNAVYVGQKIFIVQYKTGSNITPSNRKIKITHQGIAYYNHELG